MLPPSPERADIRGCVLPKPLRTPRPRPEAPYPTCRIIHLTLPRAASSAANSSGWRTSQKGWIRYWLILSVFRCKSIKQISYTYKCLYMCSFPLGRSTNPNLSIGGSSFSPSDDLATSGGGPPTHSSSASSSMAAAAAAELNSTQPISSAGGGYCGGGGPNARHSLPDMMTSPCSAATGAAPRKSALKASGGYRFNSSSITLRHMPPPEFADSPTPSCSDYVLQQQQQQQQQQEHLNQLHHHHQSTLPRLSSSSYRHPPPPSQSANPASSGAGGASGSSSTSAGIIPHHSSNSSSSSNSHYCNGGSSTLPLKSSLKKPLSLIPANGGSSGGAGSGGGSSGGHHQQQQQQDWETHSRSSMEELRV